MKLAPRTFRVQWDAHAWVGALASLPLFVVFFCGVFALFREDLLTWQEPPAAAMTAPLPLEALRSSVREAHPEVSGKRMAFAFTEGAAEAVVSVADEHDAETTLRVHRSSGAVRAPRSRLAEELYALHFFDPVPAGIQLAGLLAVALLVTLVTGTVIHLKDLWAQRWRFRPEVRLRFSASDVHKVLGVFGLPFAVLYAWSGAVLCLAGLVGGALACGVYKGDTAHLYELKGYPRVERVALGEPRSSLPLDDLVTIARDAVHSPAPVQYLTVELEGDARSWVAVYFRGAPFSERPYAYVDAVSGELLGRAPLEPAPGQGLETALFDLHFASFAGPVQKGLYTLLALATAAVILTGNVVWLERRDRQRRRRGNRIFERLTVGASAGLVVATALYFAANQWLPGSGPRRVVAELWVFYGGWALAVGLAFAPQWTPRVAVRRALGAAGTFWAAILVARGLEAPSTLASREGITVAALLALLAAGCIAGAHGLRTPTRAPVAQEDAELPEEQAA